MDYLYYFRFEALDTSTTIQPSLGRVPSWGRGLTQAFELEVPNNWNGIQSTAIVSVVFYIVRGDNAFIVYQSANLAVNTNHNLVVERYLRPTDRLMLALLDVDGLPCASDSVQEIPVRVLMREE